MTLPAQRFLSQFFYWVGLEGIYQMQLRQGIGMTREGVFNVSSMLLMLKDNQIAASLKNAAMRFERCN